jgi:hypothetical protein
MLPCDDEVFTRLPRSIDDYWHWQTHASDVRPFWGRYHWVLQTCLYLQQSGCPVELVRELPDDGIVISHVECFDYGLKPSSRRLVVALLVDSDVPNPGASLHVTHNPVQGLRLGMPYRYMPPWPQVSLQPRAASREQRFETVGFFGYPYNLHPDLASDHFQQRLQGLGLRLVMPAPARWHDFAQIDTVLAIRNFGRSASHLNKPSLKLINAWLAGVPAVLGHESAFRAEGRPGQGYLEATNEDEAYAALARLAESPALRRSLVDTGMEMARGFSVDLTRQRWVHLIDDELVPAYRQWLGSPARRLRAHGAALVKERLLWRMAGRFLERQAGPG